MEKPIEEILTERDLFANDVKSCCEDLADTFCGDNSCVTCITDKLMNLGYRKVLDVLDEIERVAMSKIDGDLSIAMLGDTYYIEAIDELKKKYESEGGE